MSGQLTVDAADSLERHSELKRRVAGDSGSLWVAVVRSVRHNLADDIAGEVHDRVARVNHRRQKCLIGGAGDYRSAIQ